MNVTEYKVTAFSQAINTVLTGLIVAGVCWLLMEVNGSREKWARIEERLTTIQKELAQWNRNHEKLEERVIALENRVIELERKSK
ncbi:MAG: hypothetical protein ACK4ML_00750 [Alishewanella aestuarii]